jgi:hypothetical protein
MRRPLIACCLCLVLWPASAQAPSLDFAGNRYVKQQEDAKPGDIFVIFGLAGETEKTWTKRIVFHAFPDSGSDVAKGVGELIKWIKQRDEKVRFGLLERKRDNEAIVDFLLSPGLSESVEFNVLRYAAGADRKGLIAAHYLFRFNLGELDGNDLKKVRRQAIDAMARFEMQAVHAHFATRRRSE